MSRTSWLREFVHALAGDWPPPPAAATEHPGVMRLVARCDELDANTLGRHAHGGGVLPALLTTAEVRALLAGGEQS